MLKFLPGISKKERSSSAYIKSKYDLTREFIFYPAQFWPHKNHIYILKSLKILKEKYDIKIDAIFSGSDVGNLKYILQEAKKYEIEGQIRYIGYASDEDISHLYRNATALVMPTYFGPTNIPPLEAFAYGCPVCYSNLDGLREQVGQAAFLMDLEDPESLCKHLVTIFNEKDIVNEKVRNGKKLLEAWSEDDFYDVLIKIIEKYEYIRQCWQ